MMKDYQPFESNDPAWVLSSFKHHVDQVRYVDILKVDDLQ